MSITYRREIDGLRAIAVAAVVLYHGAGFPSGGFAGVDVFFAISGYLITALLLREHADHGRISLSGFYARRVRRILPAVSVVILAVLLAAPLLLLQGEALEVAESAATSILFVANFYFEAQTGGYFAGAAEALPLLHLWSLAVEEQFYLFWPLLLMGLLRWRPHALGRDLVLLALASFVLAEVLVATDANAAFYQMPSRLWELALGGVVAALDRSAPRGAGPLGIVLVGLGVLLPTNHFPGLGALPAAGGTALVIWAIQSGAKIDFLKARPMVGLGLISYSLYLWHWPLLAFYRAMSVGGGRMEVRLALCAVALVLAVATYRYIETPFRRPWPVRPALMTGGAAIAVVFLSAGAVAHASKLQVLPSMSPPNPIADFAERDRVANFDACHRYQYGTPGPGCRLGAGKPTVATWGDSFALNWQPVAWEIARRKGGAALTYSSDGCPPLLGYAVMSATLSKNEACKRRNADAAKDLARFDTVVLATHWAHYVPALTDARRAVQREAVRASLRQSLEALDGVRDVVVLAPTPVMRDAVPRCLRLAQDCAIPLAKHGADTRANLRMLQAEAARFPNVRVLDPTGFLCGPVTCPAVRDGVAVYTDEAHVSNTVTEQYARQLR